MLFVGVDWSETYYDLCLMNHDGRVLAVLRIGGGLAGVGALHTLVTANPQDPAHVAVGIETHRGAYWSGRC
jgi:cation diffusion facilitator CzcD-associated flavoprotein CzcO